MSSRTKVSKSTNDEEKIIKEKKDMIYNPTTNKMVVLDSAIGKKLLSFKEREIIIKSQKDAIFDFITELVHPEDDETVKKVYDDMPEEIKYVLSSIIPLQWGGGESQDDLDKKPKKITAFRLFSNDRKPILHQELDDPSLIRSTVAAEWKKYSNKVRKNKTIYIKYNKLAKMKNADFEERLTEWKKIQDDEVPKTLSEKDQKKIDDHPGEYEISSITGRPNKIKTEKEAKKKVKRNVKKEESEEDESEKEESEEELKPKSKKKVVAESEEETDSDSDSDLDSDSSDEE
jgi:hypothetical protein